MTTEPDSEGILRSVVGGSAGWGSRGQRLGRVAIVFLARSSSRQGLRDYTIYCNEKTTDIDYSGLHDRSHFYVQFWLFSGGGVEG